MPSVALATCRAFADLDADDRLLLPELARVDITAEPAVWDDPDVDWAAFDAVVIRETWDYTDRRAEFLRWLRAVELTTVVMNPVDILQWNTDKHYLTDLQFSDVPVVPTTFVEPGTDPGSWRLPSGAGEIVVKPTVSAGSRDTVRYAATDPRAHEHIARLVAEGRSVMIQPYLSAIDTEGETGLVFIAGEFSHAIRKAPMLEVGVLGVRYEDLFVPERIESRTPSTAERRVADRALAVIPGGARAVVYARVDVVLGDDGDPRVLELELTEPSLFLARGRGAPERLARAIRDRLLYG